MHEKSKTFRWRFGGVCCSNSRWNTVDSQSADRSINPFLSEQTSYAKVPQGTQRYRNIELYTAGQEKPTMMLKEMTGYDPEGQYVTVQHKGQYVKRVTYVSKEAFLERMPQ
ncbi:hypothetical protein [Lacticaseibacillus chiayiensis]|uniref:Uncharacterized protein n=1 Tax=Lacticaseibacillus chiayiensis TaxID=2100821 RepID=A0ABY6H6X3_9LACO|nr:hypothetical protein [Lacticaseibacillus chiayiensis]UYN56615.1 hypothetical protein OFW50_00460 [Lacticaseibacillus chiayiensis]